MFNSQIPVILLVLAVIAIQASPAGHQIAYLGITFSASLMFIHYTEYSQFAKDEAMVAQHIQLALSQIQAFRARNQADRACGDSGVSQSH